MDAALLNSKPTTDSRMHLPVVQHDKEQRVASPYYLQQTFTAAAQHQEVAISRQGHVLHSKSPLPPAQKQHSITPSAAARP
jgi:hypothetical protein